MLSGNPQIQLIGGLRGEAEKNRGIWGSYGYRGGMVGVMIPSTNMCNFSSGGLKYQNMRCRCSSCSTSRCVFFVVFITHWGRDKMAAIFQTTFLNGFSWMKMYEFRWMMMVRLPTHICITPPQWQLGHHRWYWRLLLWQGIMANLHFQCPLWLHHWNWGNHMIVPMSVKWPWTIWVTDPIHSWMRYTT